MKHAMAKSSFTLPPAEVSRVTRLKKRFKYKSNTAVIRHALEELERKTEREQIRRQFEAASRLVRETSQEVAGEFDSLEEDLSR